jgi:hypothetical protein
MLEAHTAPDDEMTPEFYEAVLDEIGLPAWYRNPLVAEAIDRAWNSGLRSTGEIAQSVLKSNLRIRKMVEG